MADISAGIDLINTVFIGQNLSATDVTDITAGRDIVGTTTLGIPVISSSDQTGPELPVVQGNTFVIGGPGAFFLQAGRDAGPFLNSAVTNGFEVVNGSYVSTGVLTWAGGIQSVGNLYNPWLPQQGASIVTEFGVAKGQDFNALVNYYLSPSGFASLPDYLFTQTTTSTGLPVVDRNQEIYSLDLLTWLKSAAPSIISAFGASSPASQVAQALESNQPVTLAQALAVSADPGGAAHAADPLAAIELCIAASVPVRNAERDLSAGLRRVPDHSAPQSASVPAQGRLLQRTHSDIHSHQRLL